MDFLIMWNWSAGFALVLSFLDEENRDMSHYSRARERAFERESG